MHERIHIRHTQDIHTLIGMPYDASHAVTHASKATYKACVRPIIRAKETYHQSKRDLLSEEKRPIIRGKETYHQSKRDQLSK